MSEHEKDTAFLRLCILYVDSAERHQLEQGMSRLQRDGRSVRRAVWLMALLAGLALAGLGYAAVFVLDTPQNMTEFIRPFVVKAFCALGLGSLICLLAFVGLGAVYRRELNQRRDECRLLATRLLEARLDKPRAMLPQAVANN